MQIVVEHSTGFDVEDATVGMLLVPEQFYDLQVERFARERERESLEWTQFNSN